MNWNDIDIVLNDQNSEEVRINNLKRYEYVKNHFDDLGYMLSKINSKKVGMVHVGNCPFPFHNEKTASFTIYEKGFVRKGIPQEHASFYCYGCGEGGDVIRFRQLYDGISTKLEASKIIEKEIGIDFNQDGIRKNILMESIDSIKNSTDNRLNLSMINLICANITRDYLKWIKENFEKNIFDNEFEMVQDFLLKFDNSILEMTMSEAEILLDNLNEFIFNRKIKIKDI